MNETREKLLRTKEAADLLGVHANSMRVIENHGLIAAVRDWAGHRRFKESAVLEFRKRLLAGELRVQKYISSEAGFVIAGDEPTKKSPRE